MGATPTLTPLEAPTATCCAHCGRERWEGASTITTPAGTPTRKGSSTTQSSARTGLRAVALALLVLALTAGVQAVVFAASGSVALLADLIHNTGDAATAIPLGIAFALRSAQRGALGGACGRPAIFVSACVAGYEAVDRLVSPRDVENLVPLAAAGALGFAGNWVAALIRTRAGRRLESAALVADGDHARADAYISLGVVASAGVVALGLPLADPLIALAICGVILRITCCPETFDGRVDALRGPWEELTSV